MPSFPVSGLSAQHFVTAAQYNNMMSAVLPMPLPWTAPTAQSTTVPSATYIALMMLQPSASYNGYGLLYSWQTVVNKTYSLISFSPNLLSYKNPSTFGIWQAALGAGPVTNGATGNPVGGGEDVGQSTATITGAAYSQWDLNAIVTGTLFWNFAANRLGSVNVNSGSTASAALRVSNDGITYTLITAFTSNTNNTRVGSGGMSASVPMRYVQLTVSNWGIVAGNPTAIVVVGEIAVFTSSGVIAVPAEPGVEVASAPHSGSIIAAYSTAAGGVSLTWITGWSLWRY